MRIDVRQANEAWEQLLIAHTRLMRAFEAEDDWGELTLREYDVLYTLAKASAPLRLGDLQDGVLLSQPALSRMVDRLADRGLVHRADDPDDARAVLVCLTDAGAEHQRDVGRAHGASVARAVSAALTAEEQRTLAELCGKLAGQADVCEARHDDAAVPARQERGIHTRADSPTPTTRSTQPDEGSPVNTPDEHSPMNTAR